jgi:hypothetical protein
MLGKTITGVSQSRQEGLFDSVVQYSVNLHISLSLGKRRVELTAGWMVLPTILGMVVARIFSISLGSEAKD